MEGGFFHELDRIVSIESTRVAVFGTSEQRGHDRETQEASTNSLNANDNKKWGRKKRKKKERQRHSRPKKKKRRRHGRNSSFRIGWLIGWLCCSGRLVFGWLVGWLVFLFSFLRILRLVASGWCDTTRRHTTQGLWCVIHRQVLVYVFVLCYLFPVCSQRRFGLGLLLWLLLWCRAAVLQVLQVFQVLQTVSRVWRRPWSASVAL